MKRLEKLEKFEIKSLLHKIAVGGMNCTYSIGSGRKVTHRGTDSYDVTPTHNTSSQGGIDSAVRSGLYTEDNYKILTTCMPNFDAMNDLNTISVDSFEIGGTDLGEFDNSAMAL